MKLLFEEAESEALARWLAARSDLPKVTSQLALVEVVRVCGRLDPQAEPAARQLRGGLDLVPVTAYVAELATHVGGALLRSLGAIHLASALFLRDGVEAVVAYDVHLQQAAAAEQLAVVAPA